MDDLAVHPALQSVAARPLPATERRDVERAIEHWQRNTWGRDCVPLIDTFDFRSMRGDWRHRFLICGDHAIESARFVVYGPGFASLLGLPPEAVTGTPFLRQIPEEYADMFSEGCSRAIVEAMPVMLSGEFAFGLRIELFRAAFMPIMLHPNWSKQLVLGSFNCKAANASR